MSFIVLAAVASAGAYLVGRRWAIAIPSVVGVIVAGVAISAGAHLDDTGLPFAVAVATLGATFGLLVRRQRGRDYSAT